MADLAALNVINNSNYISKVVDFFPDGSDERQFCSPGFNLPVGLIMRKMYGTFKEYHNSLDDENFISFKRIIETINIYYEVILSIEKNFTPISTIQYGTPQLSKYGNDLYPEIMNFADLKSKKDSARFILEILNLAEGNLDLLQICEKKNFKLIEYFPIVEKMLKYKLIKSKN